MVMKKPDQLEKVKAQNEQNLQIPHLHLHFRMLEFCVPSAQDLLVQAFHGHLLSKYA